MVDLFSSLEPGKPEPRNFGVNSFLRIFQDGNNRGTRSHLSDPIIVSLWNINIPSGIDGNARYEADAAIPCKPQTRLSGRTSVTGENITSISGDGSDDPTRVHYSNPVILGISDIKIPRYVDGNAARFIQTCHGGRPAVTVETSASISSHSGDCGFTGRV